MKRRDFVRNMSLASVAMPIVLKDIKYQPISKKLFNYNKSLEDRVLVIIRMNGGNDGLNTVIPINQYDNLVTQRQNVLVPESSILELTPSVGLHPVMTGMSNMFNDGKLSIIQNVGYPEQNRSHFRSMDIWSSGIKDSFEPRGWLGRYMDNEYPNYPDAYPNATYPDPFAISMGSELSSTCQGLMANFCHSVNDPFDSFNLAENQGEEDGTYFGSHMAYLNNLLIQSNAYGASIVDAANAGNTLSTLYDDNNPLAVQLRYIAQMVSGGLKTKVYILNVDGFDTHDSQVVGGSPTTGAHANLLKRISDAVAAFQDDLNLLGLEQRVAGMTFSEFGRQVASNASLGTDHGDAAPMFLFGACIDAGIVGPNPVIDSVIQNQAGVPMQIDFRDVYASILKDWFEVPENEITPLFEHTVNFINVLGACNLGTDEKTKDPYGLELFPNPASNQTNLKITGDGTVTSVKIVDLAGRTVLDAFTGNLSVQQHTVPLDISSLQTGQYLVSVQSEKGQSTVSLIKVEGQ